MIKVSLNLMNMYSRFLEKKPFLSTTVTTGLFLFSADVITQLIFEKRKIDFLNINASGSFNREYQFWRSISAGFTGLTVMSFNLYFWYQKILPAIVKKLKRFNWVKKYPIFSTTAFGNILFKFINKRSGFICTNYQYIVLVFYLIFFLF